MNTVTVNTIGINIYIKFDLHWESCYICNLIVMQKVNIIF